jgi:hypothetical protein
MLRFADEQRRRTSEPGMTSAPALALALASVRGSSRAGILGSETNIHYRRSFRLTFHVCHALRVLALLILPLTVANQPVPAALSLTRDAKERSLETTFK